MKKIIINKNDNVGVNLSYSEAIPLGHKFALKDIKKGEYIYKYGEIIGIASKNIISGEWVHSHNMITSLASKEKSYCFNSSYQSNQEKEKIFFNGYKRAWGNAGIRNDIYIIPTVGCVNGVCKTLEKKIQNYAEGKVDGVFALTHQFGCSQIGEDHNAFLKLLCSVAKNPNASFVLFIGLGCENNQISGIKDYFKKHCINQNNFEFMICQEENDEIEIGLNILKKLIDKAKDFKREKIDFSEIRIGLKCGGSDGFSGITANPLVGRISDKAIDYGASVVMTEIPEMFGAEQLILNKCKNEEVFNKCNMVIEDFKNYYKKNNCPIYENPSPGNKAGGITTLEEKSLGCITKGGSRAIFDVIEYGDFAKEKNLTILNSPGNDLVASTALVASGCQIILFTTGRGTPLSALVPTIKISTNNELFEKKNNWIDFNAFNMEEEILFELILKTISGEYKCKTEDMREFAYFKNGVTL